MDEGKDAQKQELRVGWVSFQFCEADLGMTPLEVDRAHIELWIRALEKKGLMASTINGKLKRIAPDTHLPDSALSQVRGLRTVSGRA